MKQASAFSALDLRQTFNPLPFVAADKPSTNTTTSMQQQQQQLSSCSASNISNKSRARSCFAASSTFRPNPAVFKTVAIQNNIGHREEAQEEERTQSERPLDFCESFEFRQHTSNNQLATIKPANEVENEPIRLQQINCRINQSDKMSHTMQSIQSLSMQLNRAASLSASLDDSMSVSQEISASRQAVDSSGSGLASGKKLTKLVGKKASRMKEILLQNLGKSHRTTDELFEMYEENFYKQQAQAVKIQKEFKNYMNSLKGAQDAGKTLNLCIQQSTGVYQSARHDLVCENLSQLDILNEDLLEKLRGQIQVSLCEYMSQFSELRDKILKRKRKLIDYDSSRRVYEIMLANVQRKRQTSQTHDQQQQQQHQQGLRSLRPSFMVRPSSNSSEPNQQQHQGPDCVQSAASQLVDEARLLKLREQYNYCKIMFETINSELYQELPMVYEKKMKHLLLTLQNYFSLEAQFHSNAGKLFATAGDVIDELPMSIHRSQQQNPLNQQQHQQAASKKVDEYVNHKASGSSGVGSSRGDSSLESSSSPDNSVNGSSSPSNVDSPPPPPPPPPQELQATQPVIERETSGDQQQEASGESSGVASGKEQPQLSTSVDSIEEVLNGGDISCQLDSLSMDFGDSSVSDSVDTGDLEALKQEPTYEDDDQMASTSEGSSCSVIEVNPTAEAKPSSIGKETEACLYKVKTNHKYLAEDVDELCFEADEIIQVVAFGENQEQEEGWLMGIREVNGQKGLFPANFTKPISFVKL